LKSCFEQLGSQDVSTYINSGNIIFKDSRKDIPKLVQLIESGIKDHRKMDIRGRGQEQERDDGDLREDSSRVGHR
jgi:uncharacterized protein (DUF1697 family)